MNPTFPRRTFLAAASMTAAPRPARADRSNLHVGVQLGAHSLFDEGVERVLDNLAHAEVNAVYVYSHMYQSFAKERKLEALAADHGVAPIDPSTRELPPLFEMAAHHDFIKPVVYNAPAGGRIRSWALDSLGRGVLRELDPERLLQVFYDVLNYDNQKEPTHAQTAERGFSADYVYRETRRCVQAVAGRSQVYAGIGIDIFGRKDGARPQDAEEVAVRALEAGADGLLISREYDEMRIPSLKAVGAGVRRFRARA